MIRVEELNPSFIDIDNFDTDIEEDQNFDSKEAHEGFKDYYYENIQDKYADYIHDLFELIYTDQELLNQFIEILHSKDDYRFKELVDSLDLNGLFMEDFFVYMGSFFDSSMNVVRTSATLRLETLYLEFFKAGAIDKCNKIINMNQDFINMIIEKDQRFNKGFDTYESLYDGYRTTQKNIVTILKTCGIHFPFINKWPVKY